MRVLVTGHKGYLGSVLTGLLRRSRFEVVGLDSDLFRGCNFGRMSEEIPEFDLDIRDVTYLELLSFDAVVHLAAISDDAAGVLDRRATSRINYEATCRLAQACIKAGVPRLVFASTCAVYGRSGSAMNSEDGPVEPRSEYAQSKLAAELELRRLAACGLETVSLRLGTVYGVSPRLRLDTVVNELVGSAVATGRVDLRTNGAEWRPLVHVEDVARAIAGVLTAPPEAVTGRVFNVVPPEGNYRIIDVADAVAEWVAESTRAAPRQVAETRSYCADGSLLLSLISGFRYRWTLAQGIKQLRAAMSGSGLTPGDWRSDRYRRCLRLQALRERGELRPDLRPRVPSPFCFT